MPWQQLVADVGLELTDEGLPAYREVVISVPRQNGKTTLLLAWEVDRALSWGRPQRIIYSAQTGRDAREKLLEDQVPILERSPLSVAVKKVISTNGGESVVFVGGSRLSTVASSESAGHGKTIGLGVVDEAFDDVDNRREQALSPAMRTVRDAQLVVASTMGTDASHYLNRKVEVGRQVASADRDDSRMAYFEWSAPDECDIGDPKVWAACTPALGYTVDLSILQAEYESNLATPGEFKRFALNQRTASDERVISEAAWATVCDPHCQPDGRVVFAVDTNPERSWSSIAVSDGKRCELVNQERGTGWLAARVEQLARDWSAQVVVQSGSPAASLITDLRGRGINVREAAAGDFTRATGLFYDAVMDGQIQIRADGRLDGAVAAAQKRPSGDAWVWARKTSLTDISPLCAVTLAFWAANERGGPSKYWSSEELWAE